MYPPTPPKEKLMPIPSLKFGMLNSSTALCHGT